MSIVSGFSSATIYIIALSCVQNKQKSTHLISYFIQMPLINLCAKPCLKSHDRKLSARDMPRRWRGRSGPDSFSGLFYLARRDHVTGRRDKKNMSLINVVISIRNNIFEHFRYFMEVFK